MNEHTSTTSSSTPTTASASAPAVLLLDPRGRVSAANSSARQLWQTGDGELIGEHFASLFVFEVVSNDPEFLDAQWDVLVATALDQAATLTVQPREGAPCDMRVRLEKSLGADGYLAVIQTPPAAPVAPAATDAGNALTVLAEKGTIAFFDLHFKVGRARYSAPWKKMLGYADAELADTYESWTQLIHPEDSGAAPDKVGKKLTVGARPFSTEFRMKHRLGHWVWVHCLGVQTLSALGELDRVVGLHLDITERKELEEASMANDARMQDLSGVSLLGAFELDFHAPAFWYSPAWKKILGYDEEDELPASPETFAAALPSTEAAAGLEAWLLARSPGKTDFIEPVQLTSKDGHSVPVLLGLHRVVTRKRELARAVGFITAMPDNLGVASASAAPSPVAAAAAAAASGVLPDYLNIEAFATLAEAVMVADPRGKVLFVNPVAARLVMQVPENLVGRPFAEALPLVNRESGRKTDDPVDRALATDKPLGLISDDAINLEGTAPLPVVWTARANFGPDNKPRGVVIVFRNPEEMTLTPEELVKANRFESLGFLAGGIAHDFNNLLTTILGGISIARGNRDDQTLKDAEKACDTAKGLTKQLLAFAKGGAGVQIVAASKTVLEDAVIIAAAGSTAVITVEVADNVDPIEVERSQILQVFQNLIVNAQQAMPPAPHIGRIQLRAANVVIGNDEVSGLAAGNYVEFEVRDNASGIKPEHVAKIFDPFFTTKKHGTGLGLATVLSVVRKHGGQIGVDSTLGVGTAFTVYLPRADKPVEIQRRAMSIPFARTNRVLLMDDDEKICTLTVAMLTGLGYTVDVTRNGEEALAKYSGYYRNLKRSHYDVVIMDLTVIGGMGGEECFKKLKELDPHVRAVVSTGYDNEEMNRRFIELGFLGYITKPYRATELGKKLREALG